jgi:patatin-related protein
VDRRVVYIDPSAAPEDAPVAYRMPGFFTTLKGALSDIPMAEPISDELNWVARLNERARRFRDIIETARPQITTLVADVMTGTPDEPLVEDRIQGWREKANVKASREAGFAYEAYVRLKLASARDFVSQRIVRMRGVRSGSPFARAVTEIIDAWATESGTSYDPAGNGTEPGTLPRWVRFLLTFDLDYRKRRLRFLIEGQNRLYQMIGSPGYEALDPAAVDRLKRKLYECMERLENRETAAALNPDSCATVSDLFGDGPTAADLRDVRAYAKAFAAQHRKGLDRLVETLGADIDLAASTRDIDLLLCESHGLQARGLQDVLVNYLGFPFWDVLTFPILPWREAGEFNEIRIDRISAQDSYGLKELGSYPLKGLAFQQFAAFLSRAYRENDYLLGRLNAADRLIDLVCDAAEADADLLQKAKAIKRRAFARILDAEERHLPTCKDLIADIRAALQMAARA